MRKIFFTWKPSFTPNINKVKRPPNTYDNLLYEWPNFFFASRNQLLEFDFFNLTSRGELLESYNYTRNRYTGMPSKFQLTYILDSSQNISKIIGLVPGSSGSMEMDIQYEKIQ